MRCCGPLLYWWEHNTHGQSIQAHTIYFLSHHHTRNGRLLLLYLLVVVGSLRRWRWSDGGDEESVCMFNMFNWCARNRTNGSKQSRAHAGCQTEMQWIRIIWKKLYSFRQRARQRYTKLVSIQFNKCEPKHRNLVCAFCCLLFIQFKKYIFLLVDCCGCRRRRSHLNGLTFGHLYSRRFYTNSSERNETLVSISIYFYERVKYI